MRRSCERQDEEVGARRSCEREDEEVGARRGGERKDTWVMTGRTCPSFRHGRLIDLHR